MSKKKNFNTINNLLKNKQRTDVSKYPVIELNKTPVKKERFLTQTEINKRELDANQVIRFAASQMNLIFVLSDIQERILTDLVEYLKPLGMYKFQFKQDIEKVKHIIRKQVEEINNSCSENDAIEFGVDADAAYNNFMKFVVEYVREDMSGDMSEEEMEVLEQIKSKL